MLVANDTIYFRQFYYFVFSSFDGKHFQFTALSILLKDYFSYFSLYTMLVVWSQFDDISTILRFTIIAVDIWFDYPI